MTPDRISSALGAFAGVRVAVVGDVMLDTYVWGEVSRISPDAPVQVVDIRRRSHAIGGAGNVAKNLVAAGARVALFGAVGADAAGDALRGLLEEAGIACEGLVAESARPTTTKTRVLARGQNVVRLDEEVRTPLSGKARARLLDSLSRQRGPLGAVFVSDYAKGVVDERLVADLRSALGASGRDVPIVVDPKSSDFTRYMGATAVTPNQREAEIAAGMTITGPADLAEAARRIRAACRAPWVLITRGEKGMALSDPQGAIHEVPARALEVFDVTGAGDTVLAYFGMALATGLDPLEGAA